MCFSRFAPESNVLFPTISRREVRLIIVRMTIRQNGPGRVSFFRRCSWFAYRVVACSGKSRFLEFRKQRLFFGFHYGAAPPMKSTEKNHYFQTEIDLPASRVSTCLCALDEIIFKKQKNQIKRVNCNVVHETDDGSRAAGKTWKTGGTRYTVSS